MDRRERIARMKESFTSRHGNSGRLVARSICIAEKRREENRREERERRQVAVIYP